MSILGDNNLPGSGSWFDVTGNKQFWTAGQYTMPSPGGYASNINVYCAGDGGTVTGQLVLWDDSTNIVYQTGNITLSSGSRSIHGQAWQTVSIGALALYIPAGNYEIGFWSSGHVVWTFEGTGGVNQRSGLGSPSNNSGNNDEYAGQGFGRLGAYLTYAVLGAPTLSSATPNVGVAGTSVALVGTNLLQTSAVSIGGTSASFVVNSDTSITATVPVGAATGPGVIQVTTPAGSTTIAFTIGSLFADNSSAWVGGSIIQVDDGAAYQTSQLQIDNGTTWVTIG